MMTAEQIYDLVAYFMKDDIGLPYRYDELKFEQRSFIDALVENFETSAEQKICELEYDIKALESELVETEMESRRIKKELKKEVSELEQQLCCCK